MAGSNEPQEDEVYHGFYQWVGIALFGQSFTFYIPHFLWKSCEGKKVERLVSGDISGTLIRTQELRRNVSGIISPVATEDVKNKHKQAIAEYFHCNKRRHAMYGARNGSILKRIQLLHRWSVFRFFICEVLNLLNVSLQVYLIDSMLGGEFSTFGVKVS